MPIVTLVRLLQLEQTVIPSDVTELGMTKLDKFVPEKAPSPMLVTELGIVATDNLEQLLNAPLPMVVTELGMSILVSPELEKALRSIVTTELGIVICSIEVKANAQGPIVTTEAPSSTMLNLLHKLNAPSSILVTDGPIYTLFMFRH